MDDLLQATGTDDAASRVASGRSDALSRNLPDSPQDMPRSHALPQWPDPNLPAPEAQSVLHAICWDPSFTDADRALAARGAIACSVERHGRHLGLPPGDEAYGLYLDAVADSSLVLDAIQVLGPLPTPLDSDFGTRLIGVIYDLHEDRHAKMTLLAERAHLLGHPQPWWHNASDRSIAAGEPAPIFDPIC